MERKQESECEEFENLKCVKCENVEIRKAVVPDLSRCYIASTQLNELQLVTEYLSLLTIVIHSAINQTPASSLA